ncbi:MAG: nucleotidyltransferase domain-containing protein [Bdellovibrionales bacterium]|nr:nucleotidyltransferase domain-containing protein [Bdellovibrionales bacterium]
MRPPIVGLKNEEWSFIERNLERFLPKGSTVYLFGSRYRGDHKLYSDLDMSIHTQKEAKLNRAWLGALEDIFADSDIPYKIDLSDFDSLDEKFQEHIRNNSTQISI